MPELEQRKPIKVLLYSGGMDSYVAAKLWRPGKLLYVKGRQQGMERELETVAKLGIPVVFEERMNWADLERPDGIIPLRNLYLIALASHYGDVIGLGVLKDEVNGDKSHTFRHAMEVVLDICYDRSYWSVGREIAVEYPISHFTKTDLVSAYLQAGFMPSDLLATRSCYSNLQVHCGHCAACVKRYIALVNNGLSEPYANDPSTSPHMAEIARRWDTYSEQRKAETIRAFPSLSFLTTDRT